MSDVGQNIRASKVPQGDSLLRKADTRYEKMTKSNATSTSHLNTMSAPCQRPRRQEGSSAKLCGRPWGSGAAQGLHSVNL
jgi:hypothetical protein